MTDTQWLLQNLNLISIKKSIFRATKAKMNSLLGTNSQNKKQVHLHRPDKAKKS